MHQEKNMGEVELATVSFGQSFQITPIQLAVTVSSLINGGRRVTPHFGTAVSDREQTKAEELVYPVKEGIVSSETSGQIREILEKVVSLGSGKIQWEISGTGGLFIKQSVIDAAAGQCCADGAVHPAFSKSFCAL